jgi:hypothetical protein
MNPNLFPQNSVWGPSLWLILHSASERIGSQHLKKLPLEESRIWFGLLQSLRFSLPCPLCKKHYTSYSNQTPIIAITKDILRRWLFNLHDHVNQLNQKASIPYEELNKYEAPFNFTEHFKIVTDHMNASVRRGWSLHNDVQRTIRFFIEMKCFYDFF